MLEYKAIPFEVKDIDTSAGIIQFYAAAFGNWDDGGDMIEAGAFKKTIKERGPASKAPRIKYLFNHDPNMLLGTPHMLTEDDKGLYAEAQIVPTTLGQDTLKLYEAGVINEHSIGYDAINVKYDEGHPTNYGPGRVLKEIRLWDISAVTWGMNPMTPTVGMKSADPRAVERIKARIDAAEAVLRRGNLSSDDVYEQLELALKCWRDLFSALRIETEPDGTSRTTPDDEEPRKAAAVAALRDNLKATIKTFGG